MTHKTQVNIQIPNIESLYCINCKISPIDMQDPLVKSLFHSQILTCRLIIYTMRCCIASPSIQNADDLIHIVVNKSFYDSGKLKEHLSKLKVYYSDPEPVHPKIYEACLKYTFTFRLAPHWNSIGKSYYLQGFNFLSLTSNINAVEWDILFKNTNDMKLELIPIKMNLFPLTLDSLSLPPKTVDGFTLNSNINSIDLTSFESPYVYVLPNLTRAKVVSVSKILPESCPFRNYNDLRRHWKNMYSYRLPKNEQGLLFYEVVFSAQPTQYFTYPETCILSRMPEILMCENKNEVASQFLKDLSSNVHSVCGEVIQVCRLYPQLDIEYSYVLRSKIDVGCIEFLTKICLLQQKCIRFINEDADTFVNQNGQFDESSFFKTPAELTTKPQLVNEKLKLSSLFTFKGMEKMRPDMQHHSQKVLSIMQNNKKRKRKSVKEDDNDYLTQLSMLNNCKKRMFGVNQICMPSMPKIEYEKTVVDNLDDILSFYDISSMRSKNKEFEKSSEDTPFKQIEDSKFGDSMLQTYRPRPVIKNVEDLCLDMEDADLPTNLDELKLDKDETDVENNNLPEKNSYGTPHSFPKSLNSMGEGNLPENLVYNQREKKICKSPSFDMNTYRKLQSTIHSIDLNDKILSELLPKETYEKTLDPVETQSYDHKIRSFLSSFDLTNMQDSDHVDVKKQLYEEYKKSSTKFTENDKSSNENLMKKALETSFNKSDFSENCQNNSKFKSSNISPSLLTSERSRNTDVCHRYSKEMLKENNKSNKLEREDLFQKEDNVEKEYKYSHLSISESNSNDLQTVFQYGNYKRKFFQPPQTSTPTDNTFKESMDKKQFPNFGSPVVEKNVEDKFENIQNLKCVEDNKTKSNEASYRKMNNSTSTFGNLQNPCKTPSLGSISEVIGASEIANKFNSSLQYSTDKFQTQGEVQGTQQYKKDIDEFTEQSDFLSILSESSNESDTGDYESCKLVFNEALTLKK